MTRYFYRLRSSQVKRGRTSCRPTPISSGNVSLHHLYPGQPQLPTLPIGYNLPDLLSSCKVIANCISQPRSNNTSMPQIGWVSTHRTEQTKQLMNSQYGLGSMGLAMASNLQRHLATKKALSLLYSNRTMSRGAPLQALGGIPETNFSKLVSNCGIIFTMVINIKPIPNPQSTNKPPGLKRLSPTKPPIPSHKLRPLPKGQDLRRLLNSAP
jgi:hypothetical protein